jgi:regulator of protease activity HflC (stomatin/prohibitin superfamily)
MLVIPVIPGRSGAGASAGSRPRGRDGAGGRRDAVARRRSWLLAPEVASRIIVPATQEAFKAVTARFTAEELITKRTDVREAIIALLREKMTRHGLVLDEFAIVNFAFSPTFTQAIEAKVGAEQQKLKADRDLQRIQVEAEQKVASARAEARRCGCRRPRSHRS